MAGMLTCCRLRSKAAADPLDLLGPRRHEMMENTESDDDIS